MEQGILILTIGIISSFFGIWLGYLIRKAVGQRKRGTIEEALRRKAEQGRKEREKILERARQQAAKIVIEGEKKRKRDEENIVQEKELFLRQTNSLNEKDSLLTKKEQQIEDRAEQLKAEKNQLKELREMILQKLEEVSGLSEKEAKQELLERVEQDSKQDLLAHIRKLETEGKERYQERAKEIMATAIQKYALPQVEELTTSTISLPDEEIKGRIIGKNGRNIRTFEKAAGVEVLVDEAPGSATISAFNPIRRRIAQLALEKLIEDGRIQPARIERVLKKAKEEIKEQIEKAGQAAVYKAEIIDIHPKLIELLGRLHFRTSYGQNVLLHSLETAFLAEGLAQEIGANREVAKKAGLLHDIGKAIDRQVEGSHVEIGIKLLERFKVEPAVITAMKSHHEDYPYESVEAVLVQIADAISSSRPGARKESLAEFLKRLESLEEIAKSIKGVQDCYAIEAGREIRILVRPEEVSDLAMRQIARQVAKEVQEGLTYPGEIKVNVIRETRAVEYAR